MSDCRQNRLLFISTPEEELSSTSSWKGFDESRRQMSVKRRSWKWNQTPAAWSQTIWTDWADGWLSVSDLIICTVRLQTRRSTRPTHIHNKTRLKGMKLISRCIFCQDFCRPLMRPIALSYCRRQSVKNVTEKWTFLSKGFPLSPLTHQLDRWDTDMQIQKKE